MTNSRTGRLASASVPCAIICCVGRKIPAYTVVDLTVGYDRGRWTYAAIVRNLFNELYYSYGITNGVTFNAYPAAERSLLVTAAYRF